MSATGAENGVCDYLVWRGCCDCKLLCCAHPAAGGEAYVYGERCQGRRDKCQLPPEVLTGEATREYNKVSDARGVGVFGEAGAHT